MSKNLVIVESPAKAKTISKYLGSDFVVEASVGHVRDLPRSAKGEPVPGVDLENDFRPTYEVTKDAKKVITNLKKLAKKADTVWFATDLDREGEAIAWHLAECLGVEPAQAQRVKFNAITKAEIARAFEEPLNIDLDRVNAQQTRRIVDRIVGYQVSPLLWKRVARGLSAGRVQSVAVRMVVEREREIRAFIPDEYWTVTGRFIKQADQAAKLRESWDAFMAERDQRDNPPTKKKQNEWLSNQSAITGTLHELDGKRFDLRLTADGFESKGTADKAHQEGILDLADRIGLKDATLEVTRTGWQGTSQATHPCGGRTGSQRPVPGQQHREEAVEIQASCTVHHHFASGCRQQHLWFHRQGNHGGRTEALPGHQAPRRGRSRTHHLHANRLDPSVT